MPNITPEPIMKISMGFMAAKYLFTASEIGLFEALSSGPATLDELANKTGIPSRTLSIVTAGMVSLEFIELEGNRYRNGEVAAAFLAGKPESDLRPLIRLLNESYSDWENFAEAIRTDQREPKFAEFTQQEQQIFSAGVQVFSAPAAAALATSYDFSRHNKVLDVAGGTGSFLVAVLRRNAALKGTLFELPGACAVARQKLAQEPEGHRINIVEGDIFKDRLPDGYDVLIVANTIHLFSAAHNIELIRKMRAHVQPGARLLLVDLWTDSTRAHPLVAALMSGQFLLRSGEGQAYSEQDADDWLEQTGWRKLECKPLVGAESVIIADAI